MATATMRRMKCEAGCRLTEGADGKVYVLTCDTCRERLDRAMALQAERAGQFNLAAHHYALGKTDTEATSLAMTYRALYPYHWFEQETP